MKDEVAIEREEMEVDLLIIGGGSAGLSAAYQYQSMIDKHNAEVAAKKEAGGNAGKDNNENTNEEIPEQMIVVLEKGSEVGAHSFSGAVLDPKSLKEMIPDYKEQGCPIESEVKEDSLYYLTKKWQIKAPITPPPFQNEGNYVVSISKINRWFGERCEEKGINVFPGFPAVEVLYAKDANGNDTEKVIGVRTGDRGLDKDGKPKSNFEAGMILKSKVTVFSEGTRGSLFKQHSKKLDLRKGKNPEVFEEGVKEIIQMPKGTVEPGQVIHTMGFPTTKTVSGTFMYTMNDDKIILGWVGYLNTADPLFDPHRELQKLKTHPFIAKKIKGGKVIAYGGKTLPAGGYYSMPKLFGDGWMVCGDTASMVDVKKLKGIHLAMKSGMLAGEAAFKAVLAKDFTANILKKYDEEVAASFIKSELYKTRNFHQAIEKGILASMPAVALQEITGGRGLIDHLPSHEDATTTESVLDMWGIAGLDDDENQLPKPDGELFFDKLSSVYLTNTQHDEDSPNHLILENAKICSDVCAPKYNSPCNHFCPASVYEMVDHDTDKDKKKLQINYTNCIHCKTCDIKCPFENIEWTTPEGGGGPQYTEV